MSIISVRDASFSYEGVNIFENINFDLEQGEILCLFGPNGCGKTTLLDNILGHLELDEGSVIIDGRERGRYSHREIARKIAYVPQVHERTFPYRVIDIVVMGRTPYLSPYSSPGREDYAAAEDALRMAGIAKLKDRLYTRLSGGETQLVILARALAQNAPVIIMDEPASHLDFRHELLLLETVAELVEKRRLSILISTHSPNHAFYFENRGVPVRIAMMAERRILYMGTPGDVITEEKMKRVFNISTRVFTGSGADNSKMRYIVPVGMEGEAVMTLRPRTPKGGKAE